MNSVAAVVTFSLRESVRRRVLAVVIVLSVAFLALYGLGATFAFKEGKSFAGGGPRIVDVNAFVGGTVFGLAMFSILFLGAVLAVFLTLGVVRGDAESGLLQPIVVRPIGRGAMLVGRFAGAAVVAVAYVLVVYGLALGITAIAGDWTPDHPFLSALAIAFGVVVIAALSTLASVYLPSTAQGIAIFMLFGAGLVAGLLGQISHFVGSDTLSAISDVATWLLPFEALYQGGLHSLISDTPGLTGVVLRLGPFGGAEAAGPGLALWSLLYVWLAVGLAVLGFSRRDL